MFSNPEVAMEYQGVPVTPDKASGAVSPEVGPNLGAWFHRGWAGATNFGEKGNDFVGGILDRFREADALGYDNEGDQTEN
ncbi:MAG: hypothetical protein M3Q09_04715 [Gemmatimonadota bacterium]|nr:hypothetical protein [Gemmatimonadota bacterium]